MKITITLDVNAAFMMGINAKDGPLEVDIRADELQTEEERFVFLEMVRDGVWNGPRLIHGTVKEIVATVRERVASVKQQEDERVAVYDAMVWTSEPAMIIPHLDGTNRVSKYEYGIGSGKFPRAEGRNISGPWLDTWTDRKSQRAIEAYNQASARKLAATLDAKAACEEAFRIALPAWQEWLDKYLADSAWATAEAKRVKDIDIAECNAKRLKAGVWELKTDAYNINRYSPWWCAVISFPGGQKNPKYTSGSSSGRFGKAGILEAPCNPGDIISWGQKDMRKGKGEHHIEVMELDGSMREIDMREARSIYKSK